MAPTTLHYLKVLLPNSDCFREIFVRRQNEGERTTVIHNIPVLWSEEQVMDFFSEFGEEPSRSAVLTYHDPTSLAKVLAQKDFLTFASTPHGPAKWLANTQSQRVRPHVLKARADDYMHQFDKQKLAKKTEKQERFNKMTEDGFTPVMRMGRKMNTDGTIRVSAAAKGQLSKAKEPQLLQNLYRFQRKEKKINELTKLKEDFERDKATIARMRAERKFKPY